MPTNRLVDYHIARLKDKSKEVRLKAIRELALLADAGTLDALQEVYKTDPDEEVRKAAQQAGREVFRKSRAKLNEESGSDS